ncbi:hypothetical protein AB0M46_48625 [Dactylosporangium sp. NPDC051485]
MRIHHVAHPAPPATVRVSDVDAWAAIPEAVQSDGHPQGRDA